MDPGPGWNWSYYINAVNGTPPAPTWAATYINQSYPSTITAGETAVVWAEFKNTGTGTWTHSATCIGTSSPANRVSPFYLSTNWINNSRPSDVDQWQVTTNQVERYTFIIKAPNVSTQTTYTEKFKLVQNNSTWFGPEITWTITVKPATGNITGTVKNSFNNEPIAGASVAVTGGPTATTNASGVYTISGLAPGAKTLTVSKAGFANQTAGVTVTAGQTATKNFSLESTDKTAPTIPTNLTANAVSPSQINLSWSASTDSGGAGLAGYIVYRGGSEIGRVTTTSYSDNGLNANTAYSYTVKAYDNAGNVSGASNTATATTHIAAVPIFQDGFANLNYWNALVEYPMPAANPAALANDNHNHAQFPGVNALKTVDSANGLQGCLTGHTFDIPFGTAKFESWFFDGSGLGYIGQFEESTEGWTGMPDSWAVFDTISGGTSGKCLRIKDGGWQGGAYKEFTSGFAVGEAYTLKLSMRLGNEGTWKFAPYIFVRFLNSSGGIIGTENTKNITVDNAWHTYTLTGTVPTGATKIQIGQNMYLNATKDYYYYMDDVSFITSTDVKVHSSRQGLQVRCVDSNGSPKAIYYLGTYNADPGSLASYSGGYYKVCGAGCTGWYWPLANCKERTAGWHKFTIDFTPYTGAGNEVKYYIDGTLVGSVERTLDTQEIGLNMVAYGFHYRVNNPGWFDDCAMYAAPPVAPLMGTPQTLSTTSIRWKVTDKSNNEVGFKVVNAAQAIVASASVANGSGSVVNMDETGLTPNTAYTRTAKAFNGSLDSSPTGAATKWTLSVAPSKSNVTADRAEGSTSASPDVTFTAVGGFGNGTVEKYLYAWDASPTHTWTGSEEIWDSGDLILKAPTAGNYYLHIKGYNGENVENGTLNLGPYGYFNEPPTNPTSVTETHGAQTETWQSTVTKPSFTWSGATADAGIAGYLVYFGDDSEGTSENLVTSAAYTAPAAVSTGTYYLRLRTKDNAGQTATKWMTAFEFKYDATAPDAPEVTDDGDFTGSTNKLHAMWYASDEESDVVEYQYAVGTSAGATNVVGWTSAGVVTQANISILSPGLQLGQTYYISVKAKNGAGLWSAAGSSDGIALAPSVLTIAAAKMLPDATPVALSSKVVTGSFMSGFYIEEENRTSGIVVLSDGIMPASGALVSVGGMMGVNEIGERAIMNAVVTVEAPADPGRVPGPLYINCAALGGSAFGPYTAGRDSGVGLNNVGLLVKVCGRVQSINEWDVEISDGSATISVFASGIELPELAVGDFVSVVGISSLELDPTLKSIVRLIDEDSIIKLN